MYALEIFGTFKLIESALLWADLVEVTFPTHDPLGLSLPCSPKPHDERRMAFPALYCFPEHLDNSLRDHILASAAARTIMAPHRFRKAAERVDEDDLDIRITQQHVQARSDIRLGRSASTIKEVGGLASASDRT